MGRRLLTLQVDNACAIQIIEEDAPAKQCMTCSCHDPNPKPEPRHLRPSYLRILKPTGHSPKLAQLHSPQRSDAPQVQESAVLCASTARNLKPRALPSLSPPEPSCCPRAPKGLTHPPNCRRCTSHPETKVCGRGSLNPRLLIEKSRGWNSLEPSPIQWSLMVPIQLPLKPHSDLAYRKLRRLLS